MKNKYLWDLPISLVKININTLDREVYKEITGTDSLDTVLEGVHYLQTKNVPIRLHSVINKASYPTIKSLIDYCNDNKIDLKMFQIDTSLASNDKSRIDIDEITAYLKKSCSRHFIIDTPGLPIHEYSMMPGNTIHIVKSGLQPYNRIICSECSNYPCDYGLYAVSIDPEGYVYACLIEPEKYKRKLSISDAEKDMKSIKTAVKIIEEAKVINN